MQGIDILILGSRLDPAAARRLAGELLGRRGRPLRLDGSQVETASALALEVLIAAGLQWQADGQPLDLCDAAPGLADTCLRLGLRPDAPWQPAAGQAGGPAAAFGPCP